MDMTPAWLSEMEIKDTDFMNYDHIEELYETFDDFSVDSFSSECYAENMRSVNQSFQFQSQASKLPKVEQKCTSINECSTTPKPLIAISDLSSDTFSISFGDIKSGDEILLLNDSVEYQNAAVRKVRPMCRKPIQAQDHVFAERKRREKLRRNMISLSTLLPKLTKMDKASVLEDASNYIKELQVQVKELERLSGSKRNNVQESVISMKRSRLSTTDDDYYSSDEMTSGESTADPCRLSPEIDARISGSSVLVRIQSTINFSSFMKALSQMQKLGLCIISSNAMPFAETTLLIDIVAKIEEGFCMNATELVKNLQLVYMNFDERELHVQDFRKLN